MNRANHLRQSWSRLLSENTFLLACHQRPDGDALGSALALARALRLSGKEVTVVSIDGVPQNYRFIPESDAVVTWAGDRQYDVGMLVDSEGINRVGKAAEWVRSARLAVCVDHHVPDNSYGEIRVIDSNASSTAEVVVELLDANSVPIDKTMAVQLMTGLIADTGAFRFANASVKTFEIAARLTALGAQPSVIVREVYESKPLRAVKLMGRALSSVQTDESGYFVWASLSHADLVEMDCTDEDTESIVNHVCYVQGPMVAALFREVEPERVRVSLRSREGVDVNRIARIFNGGGHVAAAGCTLNANLDEAQARVVAEVLKWKESST